MAALAAAAKEASEEAAASQLGNRVASSPPKAAARNLRVDLGLPATPGSAKRTTTPARTRLLLRHSSHDETQTSPGVFSAAPAAPTPASGSTAASLPHSLHAACVQMPLLALMALALVLGGRSTC